MPALIESKKAELADLCKKLNVQTLYVFGSIVENRFSPTSDIDFLFSFSNDLSIEQYADNFFEFQFQLEQLFGREIDLITELSLNNPFFIEKINSQKQLVYAA